MSSTVVSPRDLGLRDAWRLAAFFAAIKLVLHIATNLWQAHIGWGYFRDEMYYIACGRQLAWGYVDHGPLVAVQARVAETLFGRSLAGLRMLSALGGAARVGLTGVLAWSLGGRRAAQGLAMIGVLVVPQYLGTDGFLSMNSWESAFWMVCLLALILMVRSGDERLWLVFGVSAGLGLLNKPSMTFFLVALLAALLVTPERRLLASRWAATGVGVLVLIALPNLVWQAQHQWAMLEFLRNGVAEHKNVVLTPRAFVVSQIMELQPLNLLVWGAGLIWLLWNPAARSWRWLGLTYVFFLVGMMVLHAKIYYVTPIYPVLFAAGGVTWERRRRRRDTMPEGVYGFPVLETCLLIAGLLLLPMAIPVLRPETWVAYTRAMHLTHASSNTERTATGPLPQFYADRFGWQEEVDAVTRVYNGLSPEQRNVTGIACDNYGEASAINFLGRGLPPALSGHNNYWIWGTRGYDFDSMILIEGSTPEHLRLYFDSVQVVGHMSSSWSMPYEGRKTIYLVSGRKFNVDEIWAKKKMYI